MYCVWHVFAAPVRTTETGARILMTLVAGLACVKKNLYLCLCFVFEAALRPAGVSASGNGVWTCSGDDSWETPAPPMEAVWGHR